MKTVFLILIFALFNIAASAQKQNEISDTITVKIDDDLYTLRIAENPLQSLLSRSETPFGYGFLIQTSNRTCDLLFEVSAIRKLSNEALVKFHIATLDGEKSSSFNKRIKLKKGEKKNLILKSKQKCMHRNYSVSIVY